jgi:hypothetical protein
MGNPRARRPAVAARLRRQPRIASAPFTRKEHSAPSVSRHTDAQAMRSVPSRRAPPGWVYTLVWWPVCHSSRSRRAKSSSSPDRCARTASSVGARTYDCGVLLYFDESGDFEFPDDHFDCYVQAALVCPESVLPEAERFVSEKTADWSVGELKRPCKAGLFPCGQTGPREDYADSRRSAFGDECGDGLNVLRCKLDRRGVDVLREVREVGRAGDGQGHARALQLPR